MRRILVLYWYPTNLQMRAAVSAHLRVLDDGTDRIVHHNAFLAPPNWLLRTRFDGVVLHNTFLGVRWNHDFEVYRKAYGWLSELDTVKVAIPQDEYDHSEVLDEWLAEMRVSAVLSNFRAERRRELYPSAAGGAEFHQVLTGYIDDGAAALLAARVRPLAERTTDIVYRAARLPYWFGSHGQLKHRIAGVVDASASARGLRTNISTQWTDMIFGSAWWDFLLSGRTVIGCESGSSVRDRRGEIRRLVEAALVESPDATFEDVSASLPPGWDSWTFFAISPRHLEAVITKTCQVLVEGEYSGVLEPHRHYIPLARDFSNVDEVLDLIRDTRLTEQIAARAYEEVFRTGGWSYTSFALLIRRCLDIEDSSKPRARIGFPVTVANGLARATERAARLNAKRFPSARWFPGVKLTSPNSTWLTQGEPYLRRPRNWLRALVSRVRVRPFLAQRFLRRAGLIRRAPTKQEEQ